MKVGDLVRYRDQAPGPPGGFAASKGMSKDAYCWNQVGIITGMLRSRFRKLYKEQAVEYMCEKGDFHVARVADVELLSES